MTLLPVAHRELLVEARNGAGAWSRFLAALGGIALFGLLWLPTQSNPQVVSEILFLTMACLLLAYALLAGALHTADAIGREKRNGTLGLLLLTDLSALDIIAGKLAATATRSVYGVLALVPVLALPTILGGVSGDQVARAVLAILVTLLLSLSVGLLASILARDFKSAVTASLLSMAILGVGIDAASWIVSTRSSASPDAVRQWSPVAMFRWSMAEPRRQPETNALFHAAWHRQGALAAATLVVAAVMVRRQRPGWIESSSPPRPSTSEGPGPVGWRHVEWEQLMTRNPYAWLQRVARPIPRTFLAAFAVVSSLSFVSAAVALANPGTTLQLNAFALSAILVAALHVGLKLQLILAATRGINEDRDTGALELLVVSGIGPALVQKGHRDAIVLQYRWLVMAVYAAQFVMAAVVSSKGLPVGAEAVVVILVVGAAFLWLDADSIIRVGLRHGLKEPDPQSAFRQTFLRVLLPGWVAVLPIAVALVSGASPATLALTALAWLAVSAYALMRARKRARIDIDHGFMALAAELPFDTDDWEVRDDFRRAASAQYQRP